MTDLTHPWLQFLAQNGARFAASAETPWEIASFDGTAESASDAGGFVAPLSDLGLISVSGEDAASFLHNQLTNDVEHLGPAAARRAGYCTPKGRLLATLLMWKSGDAVMLQLPRAIQPAVQKRLQMFVLRAKAKLTDVTERHAVLGLAGAAAADALRARFDTLPETDYAKSESAAGVVIRLPDAAGLPRYQWITDAETAIAAWPDLARRLPPAAAGVWRLAEIRAGMPQVTAATQEQFVPQMINFELVGGVNFRKGCYPGQEIVARSQYLGKLKRRMLPAVVETHDVKPGMEVFAAADPGQPCGMVVNAEPASPSAAECLVELKTAALEEGDIHLGSTAGPVLRFKPLPYPLTDPA